MVGCDAHGDLNDSKFSKPLPSIGLYVALASLICGLSMAADLLHGFRHRKFWFPCKLFSLNATSLTFIGVGIKLSVDLNTSMPSRQDQLAKLSSSVFVCTVMGNSMPSLGIMDNKDLLMNLMALGILVITDVVNICIQLGTGAIYVFPEEHCLVVVLMLLLLLILCFSAITVPTTKSILDPKGFLEVFIAFILVFILSCFLIRKNTPRFTLTNWPILGMVPDMILHSSRAYDLLVEVLEAHNMTYLFKGPWFSGVNLLFTANPVNVQHISCTNFGNYPKGPEFKKIFDVLGDGIFNVDAELWEDLRTSSHVIFSSHGFQEFSTRTTLSKLKNGLIPILENAMNKNIYVDLQDLFERFFFDTSSILMTGYDSNLLSIELSDFEFGDVVHGIMDCIYYRHFKPEILWKFENWIGVGIEKRLKRGVATFDQMFSKIISSKREEIKKRGSDHNSQGEVLDVLTYYMTVDTVKYKNLRPNSDKFLRDVVLNFMIASRDTTSSTLTWLFWLLSKHPKVMNKIRDEMNSKMPIFDPLELDKLVYLHCAICETLRLYPPVPAIHKSLEKPEVLPSGHKVDEHWEIIISVYALGRMKSVWGEDAEEFRPERWISDNGGLRHEPSYKFLAFNAGPRTCLGKKLSFVQMKTVAVEIIRKYEFEVIEGHKSNPAQSVVLRMQHGPKVKVTKI